MYTDELPPRHGLFALRRWWDAVPFQDVAYCLVTDRIPQVDQSIHDAVIAPRAVLPGHPHHQVFDLLVHARTPKRLGWLGGVTLLIDALAVPGEDRL